MKKKNIFKEKILKIRTVCSLPIFYITCFLKLLNICCSLSLKTTWKKEITCSVVFKKIYAKNIRKIHIYICIPMYHKYLYFHFIDYILENFFMCILFVFHQFKTKKNRQIQKKSHVRFSKFLSILFSTRTES